MTRVSPPEEDREFPGPQASIRVTRAPCSRRCRAVHPPKAPAPMTAMWGLGLKILCIESSTEEDSRKEQVSKFQGFRASMIKTTPIGHFEASDYETLHP